MNLHLQKSNRATQVGKKFTVTKGERREKGKWEDWA